MFDNLRKYFDKDIIVWGTVDTQIKLSKIHTYLKNREWHIL